MYVIILGNLKGYEEKWSGKKDGEWWGVILDWMGREGFIDNDVWIEIYVKWES